MAVDRRAATTLAILEANKAELREALPPHTDLVVVHVDQFADVPVRHAVGGQHHDPCPLAHPGLDRVGPNPTLQFGPVQVAQLKRKKSHANS